MDVNTEPNVNEQPEYYLNADPERFLNFEPEELHEIRKLSLAIIGLNDREQDKLRKQFDTDQREAFDDAHRIIAIRRTRKSDGFSVGGLTGTTVDASGNSEVIQVGPDVWKKWGWDKRDVIPEPKDVDTPKLKKRAAARLENRRDEFAPEFQEVTGSTSYSHEIEGTGPFSTTGYAWEHTILWDFSYMLDPSDGYTWDESVSDGWSTHKVTDTQYGFTWEGLVDSWDQEDQDEYTSYKQGHFSRDISWYTQNHYPIIKLMGDGTGTAHVLISDADD